MGVETNAHWRTPENGARPPDEISCNRPSSGASMSISRRDFIGAGAAAAAGVTLPKLAGAMPVITVRERSEPVARAFDGRPVIVSAANGFDKDPSGKQGIRVA